MVMGKIENAKIYPEIARRAGIEGDVFVRISISSDGVLDTPLVYIIANSFITAQIMKISTGTVDDFAKDTLPNHI